MDKKFFEKFFLYGFLTGFILLIVSWLVLLLGKESIMALSENVLKADKEQLYLIYVLIMGVWEVSLYSLFLIPFIALKLIK